MPRGNMPRQPSRSGRHEGVPHEPKSSQKQESPRKQKGTMREGTIREGMTRTSAKAGAKVVARAASPLPKAKSAPASKGAVKGYDPLNPERVSQILAGLDRMYPGVTCALTHRSAWELVVATILSAQCTDVRVNMVTPALFEKYPTVEALAAIEAEELEPDIRSTGFFRNKSKSVVGAARKVVSDFQGEVPQTMDELLTLPGVARKTANVVLGSWFRKNEGVVVDTHVTRISRRLELTRHEDAPKIEQDLMKIVSRARWTEFSHQVIWHGRKLCVARSPKCVDCGIEKLCHAADKTWSTVEIHKTAAP